MKPLEKKKVQNIIGLRRQGFSIPEIHRSLQLPKSTISRYVKQIKIPKKFLKRWLDRRNVSKIISQENWERAKKRAQSKIKSFLKSHTAVVISSLYWAEGSKKDFSISNTDPELIGVFLSGLRRVFNVKDEDIKISIRIYEDLERKKCLRFWSHITGIHLDHKTHVDVLKGSKKGKLEFGMCRVRVRKGGLLLKELFSIKCFIIKELSPCSLTDKTRDS